MEQELHAQNKKSPQALREEAVLAFWKEHDIFRKSLEKDAPQGEFVFYEGPPTANAKPALHHLEARAFKDVLPRYKTMQGYHVRRRAGWDTHGLPVELQIEKKLGFTHKKQIEAYGIAAFNRECKESVFIYIKDWEIFTDRIGYWVDQANAYYTFNPSYMESVWNILATAEEKQLLFKDYKVVPWCARCGTTLASHELAQEYQDDKDLSVTAKFVLTLRSVEMLRSSGRLDSQAQPDAQHSDTSRVSLLAWTTTPWTLPGNVGLAVGADIEYVLIQTGDEYFILAKDRLEIVTESYEIVGQLKGSDLVGLEYEPLYPYLSKLIKGHHQEKNMDNAYKVYAADFVTTTDGTGIVHTAVMYGADDFELGTKVDLPKFHTVTEEGRFVTGTDFLEGRFVKDEDVAVDIIKDLAHRGLFFKKEKYEHSYPHCWRCKTPLIYYARDSWYIRMSELRDKLIASNHEINWEPDYIKEGRFGEWLREVKDWAISRERYWGTPLPIWHREHDGVHDRIVIDSIETLKKHTKKSGNHYLVMRHGEAENNTKAILSAKAGDRDHLTENGVRQVREVAQGLVGGHIDLIITSPFARTIETAALVAETIGLNQESIITDARIEEHNYGDFDQKPIDEYYKYYTSFAEAFDKPLPGGENYTDTKRRVGDFLYEVEQTYEGKNILIITHETPAWLLFAAAQGLDREATMALSGVDDEFLTNSQVKELDFVPLPHNEDFELDLHRPYIDEVVLTKDGKDFHRVKEVMDVWLDSGSMPFAQDHYPFENKEWIDGPGYPADFISEAIDQTRGWFYTLHAVGNLMDKGKAYRNVICLGHLLDKDGKKMSKSIGNIVEPFEQMDKFGADAIRLWMYSLNAPGESKNYDEKTVSELQRQVFGLLYNVLAFYELYRDPDLVVGLLSESEQVLDRWIMARLGQLVTSVTEGLDHYHLMNPVRDIRAFIEDLSTWYLRRSRDRIKEGDNNAKQTLYHVLKTLAQVLAPFAPFAAEDIWQKLKHEHDEESVHLSGWPKTKEVDEEVVKNMQIVRTICSEGNALRKKENIPVRQPLSKITVFVFDLLINEKYQEIILSELNIKSIEFTKLAASTAYEMPSIDSIKLDTTITPELKAEGNYREFVRAVQDMRKEAGLTPQDLIALTVSKDGESFLTPFLDDLKKTVLASTVTFADNDGSEIKIDETILRVTIEK